MVAIDSSSSFITAMETTLAVAFGSFLPGSFSRDWSSSKSSEATVCRCDCQWTGAAVTGETGIRGGGWALSLLVGLLLVALFSNAALALKVSFKDSESAADRELAFSVKGRSKRFYGAARPLQITG